MWHLIEKVAPAPSPLYALFITNAEATTVSQWLLAAADGPWNRWHSCPNRRRVVASIYYEAPDAELCHRAV